MINNQLELLCESLKNPIGIDNSCPRFSWTPISNRVLSPQKSYNIIVKNENEVVWNSDTVFSPKSIAVEYHGVTLCSFTRYEYQVTIELTDGSVYSGESYFETAAMSQEELWGNYIADSDYRDNISPLFQMECIAEKEIASARAYFSGLGYGELYINGEKVGDSILDPGWTDFNLRRLYRTYDISELLKTGKNLIKVMLGGGWMAHKHKYFVISRKPPLPWYNEPCFLLNIRITYKDGSIFTYCPSCDDCIVTDSPILENNVFDGETLDGRKLFLLKEDISNTNESRKTVSVERKGILSAQIMPPIRETEIISPKSIISYTEDTYVVDMGINFSGFARIEAEGESGSSVELRYSEVQNDDYSINQTNLRYAACKDKYILRGDGREIYSPRFSYRGYRFVEIKLVGKVNLYNIVGVRVNTDVRRIGKFECSDEMLNKIYAMLINTEINNMHSVPTDCPQRDERLGWMNDNTMRIEQNFMNLDSQLFYEKWMNDIIDQQNRIGNGSVPDSCPYFYGLSPAKWNTTVFVTLPYFIYVYYSDIQPLKKYFPSMLKYMDFQKTKICDDGLISGFYVGEWCPPVHECILEKNVSSFSKNISNRLTTSCFYYMECLVCKLSAELLGDTTAIERFESEMKKTKEAINTAFFDKNEASYLPRCQGNNVLPLFLKIVPDGYYEKVAETLIDKIIEDDYHITTGSHMTRFLFEVINSIGRNDVAIKMLNVKTYPSFGYMLENGATALWERWEKSLGFMTSHDHPMTGGFGVTFFKALGGIRLGLGKSSENIVVAPSVPNNLNSVSCSREFRNGTLLSSWYKTENSVHFDITIPWNTDAKLIIPRLGRDKKNIILNGLPLSSYNEVTVSENEIVINACSGYYHVDLK